MSAPVTSAPVTSGYSTVTFLSDYGTADEFVGVVKSVLRQLSPDAVVVDLTHDIAPFDVRGASLALARSIQYLTPGVILAVVDPGVGTARRPVAVEVMGGKAVLVGPDNGLLAAAASMIGGADRAVVLDDPEFHLESVGSTFDGRDVFAPVAAHLCNGVALADLGTEIDPLSLMPGLLPVAREEEGHLVTEVLWVDRYGNCQLNVDLDDISQFGPRVEYRINGRRRTASIVTSFAAVGVGDVGIIADANGLCALVADQSSAAEELDLGAGDQVILAEADSLAGVTTAVTLGRSTDTGVSS